MSDPPWRAVLGLWQGGLARDRGAPWSPGPSKTLILHPELVHSLSKMGLSLP